MSTFGEPCDECGYGNGLHAPDCPLYGQAVEWSNPWWWGLVKIAGAIAFVGTLLGLWLLVYELTGYGPAPCDIPGTAC
jgi:hypothetical protein